MSLAAANKCLVLMAAGMLYAPEVQPRMKPDLMKASREG